MKNKVALSIPVLLLILQGFFSVGCSKHHQEAVLPEAAVAAQAEQVENDQQPNNSWNPFNYPSFRKLCFFTGISLCSHVVKQIKHHENILSYPSIPFLLAVGTVGYIYWNKLGPLEENLRADLVNRWRRWRGHAHAN